MNYERQERSRDAQSIGQEKMATGGRGLTAGGECKVPTLNDRLNTSLDRLQMEADRLERALNRVNGTPSKDLPAGAKSEVRATRSLAQVAEEFEAVAARFRNLNEGVDQIA